MCWHNWVYPCPWAGGSVLVCLCSNVIKSRPQLLFSKCIIINTYNNYMASFFLLLSSDDHIIIIRYCFCCGCSQNEKLTVILKSPVCLFESKPRGPDSVIGLSSKWQRYFKVRLDLNMSRWLNFNWCCAYILKAKKFAESAFQSQKNLRINCVNLDIKFVRQKCVDQ